MAFSAMSVTYFYDDELTLATSALSCGTEAPENLSTDLPPANPINVGTPEMFACSIGSGMKTVLQSYPGVFSRDTNIPGCRRVVIHVDFHELDACVLCGKVREHWRNRPARPTPPAEEEYGQSRARRAPTQP